MITFGYGLGISSYSPQLLSMHKMRSVYIDAGSPLSRSSHAMSPTHETPTSTTGFSLIELLVVISILLVLVGVLVPVIQTVRTSVRVTQTTSQVQGIYAACEVYAMEDRRHMPPPMEVDHTLRTALGTDGSPRTLDLLRDRGCSWQSDQLDSDPIARSLLDAWRRPILYQPDVNMDGIIDRPAAQVDWNAKQLEPHSYVWSLGRPSGNGDVADADANHSGHWIYKKTSP